METNSSDPKKRNVALMNYEFRNNIARVQSFPTTVGVAVNKLCNVSCVFCLSGRKSNEKIEWEHFKKLQSIFQHVSDVIFSGEEVILHPDIWKMFAVLSKTNVSTSFMTNGKALSEEVMKSLVDYRVAQIVCSFHGATPETYKSIVRGADFVQNLNQFRFLKRYRLEKAKNHGNVPKPGLHFHYVMMRKNIEELPAFLEIATHLGADVVVSKFMMVYSHLKHLTNESLYFYKELTNSVLAHCIKKAKSLPITFIAPKLFNFETSKGNYTNLQRPGIEKEYPACSWPWRQCNISTTGDVQPCCGGLPPMGNIYETPFEEIWNCEKYRDLRATVNTPNRWPECKKCYDVAGAVSSDDIRRHLVYLAADASADEIKKFKPQKIEHSGLFTHDEGIYNVFMKILNALQHGNLNIHHDLGSLFDLISQSEREYLFEKIDILRGQRTFLSPEIRFLLLTIRFLNHFNHGYIAYRIIFSQNHSSITGEGNRSIHHKWIDMEKICSEFRVGYYNAALERVFHILPLMKDWFGENAVMAIVDKMMSHDWEEVSRKMDQSLEGNISRLLANNSYIH